MTADGVRALLRLGATAEDPRVVAAKRWLARNFDPEKNPGVFPERDEVRRRSGYYYWVWSGAHAMRALGERAWAEPLAEALLRRQGADGSWKNPSTEMREDDALVATPFAVAGLAAARTVITGELRSHAADARR
jgi:squalene-hopene/tetraprenyl-beta-curcumene cyclase